MTSPYNTPDTPDTPDTVAPTTPDVASANPTLPISTTPQQTYVQQAAVASPQATSPIAHQPAEAYPQTQPSYGSAPVSNTVPASNTVPVSNPVPAPNAVTTANTVPAPNSMSVPNAAPGSAPVYGHPQNSYPQNTYPAQQYPQTQAGYGAGQNTAYGAPYTSPNPAGQPMQNGVGYNGFPDGAQAAPKPKEKMIAALLSFFLGGFGAANFYMGKNSFGFIKLGILLLTIFLSFLTIVIPPILIMVILAGTALGIWNLVEFIMILTGKDPYRCDADGVPLV